MSWKEIRNAGLKATIPRVEVLSLLEKSPHRHLSAEAIYRLLDTRHADIGLATIYRVLNQLDGAGLVSRRQFDRGGGAVFELARDARHSHIVCIRCGRIEEFSDPQINERLEHVADQRGYELREYSLVIYGTCAAGGCGAIKTTG